MNKRLWSDLENALLPQAVMLTKAGCFAKQAAVMVLITDEPSPQLILKVRKRGRNK